MPTPTVGLRETSTAFLKGQTCQRQGKRAEPRGAGRAAAALCPSSACRAKPQRAGPTAGSPEAPTPEKGKLREGELTPGEQPGWKPGHDLEADQSKMVGDDHLVSQLDPS